jgi:hypothetical protein
MFINASLRQSVLVADIGFQVEAPVAEVRRRLRLSRLVSGTTTVQAIVTPAPDTDDMDVIILLSGSDPERTAALRALFPDMRVRITEGNWERN